jgi:hypothetical protein
VHLLYQVNRYSTFETLYRSQTQTELLHVGHVAVAGNGRSLHRHAHHRWRLLEPSARTTHAADTHTRGANTATTVSEGEARAYGHATTLQVFTACKAFSKIPHRNPSQLVHARRLQRRCAGPFLFACARQEQVLALVLLPCLKPPAPGAQLCPPERNTRSQCCHAPSSASFHPHSLPLRAPSRLSQPGSPPPRGPCARDCGRAAPSPSAAADAGQNEASPHGTGLWGLTAVRMACAAAMLLLPSIFEPRDASGLLFRGGLWGLLDIKNKRFQKFWPTVRPRHTSLPLECHRNATNRTRSVSSARHSTTA